MKRTIAALSVLLGMVVIAGCASLSQEYAAIGIGFNATVSALNTARAAGHISDDDWKPIVAYIVAGDAALDEMRKAVDAGDDAGYHTHLRVFTAALLALEDAENGG